MSDVPKKPNKFVEFIHDVVTDFRQMFVDQSNVVDDKRVAGLALVVSGVLYIWTRKTPLQYMDYGQIVLGLVSLGVSVLSDKLSLSTLPSQGA